MARYELRYAGTPDGERRNPFTGQMQTFPGRPGWVRSLVVSRNEVVVAVRAGREPATRLTSRRFPSAEAARDFVTKLVESHVGAGYALVSEEEIDPSAIDATAGEDDPLFVRMASGDDDAFLVYADKLLERGDPRGELIALLARPSSDARVREGLAALMARHPDALAGPLASRLERSNVTWRYGFVDGLRIAFDSDVDAATFEASALLAEVFAHPCSRLLRALTVGVPRSGEVAFQDVIDTIAVGAPDTLRSLLLGDFVYPDECEISWARIGDASTLWLALPNLEEVTFQGADTVLGVLAAPKLRSLTIRTGGLKKEPVHAIATGALPSLEHLELWLGDENYGAEVALSDLAPILDGHLPALTRLGLRNAAIDNDLCEAIVTSRTLARLRVLDLSMGTLDDDGARILLASRAKLGHLDVLDVSESFLSPAMCESLRSICREVRTGEQKPAGDRYVSVSE